MSARSGGIPVLNGIRALAVLIVFSSHASNIFFGGALTGFGGGQLGVMLFFILSGFLMAFLYIEKVPDRAAQRAFVVNRMARIYPMFFLVVIACFLANRLGLNLWVYPIKSVRDVGEHLLFIRGYEVLWTIGPEVIFYALFLVLWRLRDRKWILATFVSALIGVAWLPMTLKTSNSIFELHEKLPYFFVGCALGTGYSKLAGDICGNKGWTKSAVFWTCLAIFGASSPQALRLILDVPKTLTGDPWPDPWAYPFYLLATAAVFVTAVIARPGILTNPTAIYVGNISFSFYLLHFAVLMNMRSIMPAHKLLSVALALLVTILLSSVSYFFIEVPMRKLIRQVAGRRTVDYALS